MGLVQATRHLTRCRDAYGPRDPDAVLEVERATSPTMLLLVTT
jgi:hypothetical protein